MSQLVRVPLYDNDGDKVPGCTPSVFYSHAVAEDLSTVNFTLCSYNGGVATERLLPDGSGSGQYYILFTDEEWNNGVVDFLAVPTAADKSDRNAKDTPTQYDDSKINAIQNDIDTIISYFQSSSGAAVTGASGPGYTLIQMIDLLGLLLNELNQADDEPSEFGPLIITTTLNRAQDELLTGCTLGGVFLKLNRTATPELDVEALAQTVTGGGLDLTALTYQPDGEFDYLLNSNTGTPLYKISPAEYARCLGAGYAFSECRGGYFRRGNTLTILPSTITSVDLYYRRAARQMAVNTMGTGDAVDLFAENNEHLLVEAAAPEPANVDCELSLEVQHLILERAAAHLFRIGRDYPRAAEHDALAADGIRRLNEKHPLSDTVRMGVTRNLHPNPLASRRSGWNFYTRERYNY